jgi:O-antigen/teichoic acid export membrane protein
MAWTSVFGFLNYALWYGVLASHLERTVLFIQLAGLAVNVAINLAVIPFYGPSGAAAALVISDLLVVAGQAILVHRNLFAVPFGDLLVKPAVAAAVVVPPAVLLALHSPLSGAIGGALAYAAALLLLRYITFDEWQPVVAVVAAPFDRLKRVR